jgi:hypothetical protein
MRFRDPYEVLGLAGIPLEDLTDDRVLDAYEERRADLQSNGGTASLDMLELAMTQVETEGERRALHLFGLPLWEDAAKHLADHPPVLERIAPWIEMMRAEAARRRSPYPTGE